MNSVSFTPSFGMAYRVNGKNLAQYFRDNPQAAKEIIPQMEKANEELKDTKHVDIETYISPEGSMKHRVIEKHYFLNDDYSVGQDKVLRQPVNKQYLSGLLRQVKDDEARCAEEYKQVSQSSEVLKKLDIFAG